MLLAGASGRGSELEQDRWRGPIMEGWFFQHILGDSPTSFGTESPFFWLEDYCIGLVIMGMEKG